MVISVSHLTKEYAVPKKREGIGNSVLSLFHREYERKKAINDVSFSIDAGELIGFIGPNGAGKTTTLKCLSGLLYPTSGTVSVLGFTPFSRKNEFLKKISLVMGQKSQLWWDLPAIESFRLQKEIYQVSDAIYKQSIDTLVDLLDVSSLLTVQVRKLSLGERMKMELIASLIYQPQVLFLDEPTIGLDVVMQKKLRDFIRSYNARTEATILLTSHYMQDVRQLASRILIIDHGKIFYDGKLTDLITSHATYKILSVVLEKQVNQLEFGAYGTIVTYEFPKLVLKVPRKNATKIAAKILTDYPIEDVTIEEPDIEDVIRDVFNANRKT